MTPIQNAPNQTDVPEVKPNPEIEAATTAAQTKKHGKGWLITLIIIVVIFLGGATTVAALGVWTVPVLSSVLGTDEPIDLGIQASPEALAALEAKVPMEITSERVGTLEEMFSGEIAVDTRMSSEEMTSFLQRFQGDTPVVSNLQVKFIEGGMEISGSVHEYVEAPVYVKVMVEQDGTNAIDLTLVDAKLGRLSIPEQYRDDAEQFAEELINQRMSEVEGFSMTSLEYHDGYSNFIGTYPSEVKSHDRGWGALFID